MKLLITTEELIPIIHKHLEATMGLAVNGLDFFKETSEGPQAIRNLTCKVEVQPAAKPDPKAVMQGLTRTPSSIQP